MNTKYSLTLLVACCMIVNALDNKGCPKNFEVVGEKCYQIRLNGKNNWYEASRYCKRANSELVSIESSTQMSDLTEYLKKSAGVTPESVWTAGTDLGSVGRFYWQSNGRDIEYTKWVKRQPRIAKDVNCIVLNWNEGYDYHMENVNCETTRAFVCEAAFAHYFESN